MPLGYIVAGLNTDRRELKIRRNELTHRYALPSYARKVPADGLSPQHGLSVRGSVALSGNGQQECSRGHRLGGGQATRGFVKERRLRDILCQSPTRRSSSVREENYQLEAREVKLQAKFQASRRSRVVCRRSLCRLARSLREVVRLAVRRAYAARVKVWWGWRPSRERIDLHAGRC